MTLQEYIESIYFGFSGVTTCFGSLDSAESRLSRIVWFILCIRSDAILKVVLADVYAGVHVIGGSLA